MISEAIPSKVSVNGSRLVVTVADETYERSFASEALAKSKALEFGWWTEAFCDVSKDALDTVIIVDPASLIESGFTLNDC